ncbi:hypothetical protein RRG08_004042 [Elysia crispata]|uniref:Uncharacterized protein n=1 Tax=Elysia crispata TaxID=231223 RepID=A0AAE1E1A6_9GAST|nr:hypothetical protein RRG08_004042 [Elysia crispata]
MPASRTSSPPCLASFSRPLLPYSHVLLFHSALVTTAEMPLNDHTVNGMPRTSETMAIININIETDVLDKIRD